MKESEPQGFRVPVHRSLTEPIMIGGVPRKLAIANGVFIVSLVLGAHNLWILPVGLATHVILVALHRSDKDILGILKRNLSRPPHIRA